MKQYSELTEVQKSQVAAMFDQRFSLAPEAYTYEISMSGDVISRKRK